MPNDGLNDLASQPSFQMKRLATQDEFKTLAKRLPFALDDFKSINEVYTEWIDRNDLASQHILQLWVYCYVRRFLLYRFVKSKINDSDIFEALLEKIFLKCWTKMSSVQKPQSLASWVLRVSRNSWSNFLRDQKTPAVMIPHEEEFHPLEEQETEMDFPIIEQTIRSAITRLPAYLKEVARMRFLENLPYDEICKKTGHQRDSVRAMCHKVSSSLRQDPSLRSVSRDFITRLQRPKSA